MKKLLLVPILLLGFWSTPAHSEKLNVSDTVTLPSALTASATIMAPYYDNNDTFISKVYQSKFPFQLLGLTWNRDLPEGTAADLTIRFQSQDGTWSDWQHIEEDQDGAKDNSGLHSYIITDSSVAFQYKALLNTSNKYYTPKLANFTFDYVNGGQLSVYNKLSKLIFDSGTTIVSRTSWGADESLRVSKASTNSVALSTEDADKDDSTVETDPDMAIVKTVETDANGNKLLWPLEYPKKVKKIIIHHTATSKIDDPETSLRAIYYYHAVSRGWGDIGYNYIVDQNGKVYEGRYGGDGVVAGHAYGYNTGSIGIALLGNFQTTEIPGPMMKSLTGLIYEKAELNNIDPDASGLFRGNVLPNIMGHRDVGKTACPGEYTYDYIPEIKKILGDALDARRHTNFDSEYSYEEVGNRELLTLDSQSSAQVTIKLKNTGTATWNSSTYLKAGNSSDVVSLGKAMMNESSVKPGETGTFTLSLSSSLNGGLVNFDITPVFNGSKKVMNYLDLAAFVSKPLLKFDISSAKADSTILKPNSSSKVVVKLKNTGTLTWKNTGENKIKLKQTGSSSLNSNTSLATLKESTVKTGETGTFEFTISTPKTGGKYSLYYAPEMENSNAIVSSSGTLTVTVTSTTSDADISETSTDLTFKTGEKKSFWLKITNYSDTTWKSSGTNKLSLGLTKNSSITTSEPKLAVTSLAPGKTSKVNFTITAPNRTGTYTIYVRPRVDGKNVMQSAYTFKITVTGSTDSVDTTAYTANYTKSFRVKLTPDSEIVPILTSTSDFSVYDNTTLLKTFTANSRVRVTQNGEKFAVSSGSYSWTATGPVRFTPKTDGVMQIVTMEQRPAWNTELNDNLFRGTVEVRNVDSELTLINELALEDYMKGIGEVSNGDPTEKIKTMMVIARTYATYYLTEAEKFPGKPYNLDDDPNSSQKYLGYGYESRSPNVSAAALATAGEVVTYNGKTVITPYFTSTDGTATKSAESVWGWTNTPWLVSVSDASCTTSTSFQGHGVGLSGCGATAMANSGKTFEDIIRYYYKGVDIQKI